jgi:hypothetical protein
MALLDNGRGACCRIKVHRNLNITRFVHAFHRPSRARAKSFDEEMTRATQLFSVSIMLGLIGCDSKMDDSNAESTTKKNMDTRWKCNFCDQWHTELPFAYGPIYPDLYFSIPEEERDKRVEGDKDFCVIDGKQFFVRGRLEIPVIDSDEVFAWDVWVSQSETNFKRTIELMNTEGRESEEPYFGWLSNNLHLYPDTTNLKTHVLTQPVGIVPTIQLEATEHPLALEQRNGITLGRVKEIAALILHPESNLSTNTEQGDGGQPATRSESK